MDTKQSPTIHVLVVDDDRALAQMIATLLQREGMQVTLAANGADGLRAANDNGVQLVVLDLMLPDMTGFDVCRNLRQKRPKLPVIMLTARGDPIDRVVGLELGADDYVPKPFDARELVARIRAVLRRTQQASAPEAQQLRFGSAARSCEIDLNARVVRIAGEELELTSIEFKLLATLAKQPGVPMSREALTRATQAGNYAPLERAVDVQISRLRKKLRDASPGSEWIVTVRGEGYAFTPPAAGA